MGEHPYRAAPAEEQAPAERRPWPWAKVGLSIAATSGLFLLVVGFAAVLFCPPNGPHCYGSELQHLAVLFAAGAALGGSIWACAEIGGPGAR